VIEKREESRKTYDHYDEKMEKLYRSRQAKIRNNISENPKDYELVLRVYFQLIRMNKSSKRLQRIILPCLKQHLNV
jgi:hypothetical protein